MAICCDPPVHQVWSVAGRVNPAAYRTIQSLGTVWTVNVFVYSHPFIRPRCTRIHWRATAANFQRLSEVTATAKKDRNQVAMPPSPSAEICVDSAWTPAVTTMWNDVSYACLMCNWGAAIWRDASIAIRVATFNGCLAGKPLVVIAIRIRKRTMCTRVIKEMLAYWALIEEPINLCRILTMHSVHRAMCKRDFSERKFLHPGRIRWWLTKKIPAQMQILHWIIHDSCQYRTQLQKFNNSQTLLPSRPAKMLSKRRHVTFAAFAIRTAAPARIKLAEWLTAVALP